MPGRKNPETTESERDRKYRLMQKRGYGEEVVGERGEGISEAGDVGKVQREREKWAEERQRLGQQDF